MELLDEADYPLVFFQMDYLLSMNEKNNNMLLQKFDSDFIQAYNQKINLDKRKKKLSPF